MTTTIGLRELSRNSNILDGYDYVDDKKFDDCGMKIVEYEYFEL